MEFNQNKPIYLQIADGINEKILSGELKEGEYFEVDKLINGSSIFTNGIVSKMNKSRYTGRSKRRS